MCNCIQKLGDNIREVVDAEDVMIQYSFIGGVYYLSYKNNVLNLKPIINILHRKKGRKRYTKAYFVAAFCPICGKKYKE